MFSNPTGAWGYPIASACSWAETANIYSSRGTANMKALLLTEYMNLQVTELAEPEIGAADVLVQVRACGICGSDVHGLDRKSTRLNSSHLGISYAVFCLKKKKIKQQKVYKPVSGIFTSTPHYCAVRL